jgi:hypothetical protein
MPTSPPLPEHAQPEPGSPRALFRAAQLLAIVALPVAYLPLIIWRPPAATESQATGWLLLTISIYGLPLALSVPAFIFIRLKSRLSSAELGASPFRRPIMLLVRVLYALWLVLVTAGLVLILG